MPEAAKKRGARVKAAPPPPEPGPPAPHVCNVGFCPICLAVSAVQPLAPEVVEHLLGAGRELLLAVKAVVDSRAIDVGRDDSGPTIERIDIA